MQSNVGVMTTVFQEQGWGVQRLQLSKKTLSDFVDTLERPTAGMEKSNEWFLDGPNDWLNYSPSSVTVSYETSVRIEDSQENFVKEDF